MKSTNVEDISRKFSSGA